MMDRRAFLTGLLTTTAAVAAIKLPMAELPPPEDLVVFSSTRPLPSMLVPGKTYFIQYGEVQGPGDTQFTAMAHIHEYRNIKSIDHHTGTITLGKPIADQ